MKKLLTLLMATIMMLTLATSAWAANVGTGETGNDGTYTTIEAALEANETVITLTSDITLTETITPTTSITIDGQSVYCLDGANLSSDGISLVGNVNLKLQNLTMKNFTTSNCGAILASSSSNFSGTLTVENCKFSNFSKYAICISYGSLVMDSCELDGDFYANVSYARTPNIVQIGRGATATITNSTFVNSESTSTSWDATGLIFVAGGMPTKVTGNTFTNCETGIYFDDYYDKSYDTDYWDYDTSSSSYASDALFTQLLADNNFSGSQDSNIRTTVIAEGTAYIASDGVSTFWHPSFPEDVICYFKADYNDTTLDYFTTLEAAITAGGFTYYIIPTGETATISDSVELPANTTLTVMEGATLIVQTTATFTNSGAIINNGSIQCNNELTGVTGNDVISVVFEAQIGDATYYTLEEAITAATSRQTVEVLIDVELESILEIKKSLVLDLGGNTLTSTSASNAAIIVYATGIDVTIKNGSLKCDTIGKTIWSYITDNIILENVVVENGCTTSSTSYGVYINNTYTMATLKGECTIDGLYVYESSLDNGVELKVETGANIEITEKAVVGTYVNLTNDGTITNNGTWTNSGYVNNCGTFYNEDTLNNNCQFSNYETAVNNGIFNSYWYVGNLSEFTNNGTFNQVVNSVDERVYVVFQNYGTMLNGENGVIDYAGTFKNELYGSGWDGYIVNNGTMIARVGSELIDSGNATNNGIIQVYDADVLEDAVSAGGNIEIMDNIELTADITIANDVTITGATGNETITTPANNRNFELSANTDVTFTNLKFIATYNIISTDSSNTGSSITFDDCEFEIGGTNSSYIVYGSTGSQTDVTIKNSTIGGDIRKAVLVYLSGDSVFTFTGNTVTDEAPNVNGSVATVVMESETAKAIITGNTFTDLYRGFCIDKSSATGSWTITSNKFINTRYALNYDSNIDYNNVSMAYNFNSSTADGEGTLVALLDEATVGSGTSVVTLYPYYSEATMKTLVYEPTEDGEKVTKTVEEATTEALENALADTTDTKAIADAVTLVEILDNETIAADEDLLEMVYDLEEVLLENSYLSAEVSITALDPNNAEISEYSEVAASELVVNDSAATEVQGLAVAIVGNDYVEADTVVTLNITQTGAAVTVETEYNEETKEYDVTSTTIAVTYDISPSVTVGKGEATEVSNDEISAPITFTLHLPSIFDNTNRATVTHKDGEDIYSTDTYVVYHDGTDNYINVTTTHFSEFVVEVAESVATSTSSSSVKKYSNDLEVGDNGSAYATPLSASSGTTVYITASPDTGYEVDEVTVDDGDITVTDEGYNVYSYKQPAYAVDIEVTFVATDDVEEEEVEADENEALTDFEDVVAGAWYEEYIAAAVEAGIMQGNSTTEFGPNETTTRAMMVQVLFNLEGAPETENDEAAWYSEALAWGVAAEVTDGSDITGNLTREQLVTMLYRYAVGNGEDVSIGEDTNILSYNDALDVADWAMDAFQWACGSGIVNGDTDGNLNPQNTATRAELAKIMVSYLGL